MVLKPESAAASKLRLIDTEEFEVVGRRGVSQTESVSATFCSDPSRLGMIAKPWGHKDVVQMVRPR
jgi:hypothetical protein